MMTITKKESNIWELRFKGFNRSEIARKLDITRQAISKALKNTDSKILHELNRNARTLGLAVTLVNSEKGILLGYTPQIKAKTMIFYLPKSGFHTWFEYGDRCEECSGCITYDRCMNVLKEASEFWEVSIGENEEPTKIAVKLFENIWRQ